MCQHPAETPHSAALGSVWQLRHCQRKELRAFNVPCLKGDKNVSVTARGVNMFVTHRNQGLVVFVPDAFLTVGFYLLGSWRRVPVLLLAVREAV